MGDRDGIAGAESFPRAAIEQRVLVLEALVAAGDHVREMAEMVLTADDRSQFVGDLARLLGCHPIEAEHVADVPLARWMPSGLDILRPELEKLREGC